MAPSCSKQVIFVSGATGFVGSSLIARLSLDNFAVRAAVRSQVCRIPDGVETISVGDLGPNTDWLGALNGISVVVHAAARVHVMADRVVDSLGEYRHANVTGTLNFARQAASAGVSRFIFLSSIKVNGEETVFGQRYTPNDIPKPSDPYGISKYEAEEGLRRIAENTGMEVVIIRPVLVYGPRVKANFFALMRWLARGVPLPLGGITENRRSLVFLDNLVDLIVTCIDHSSAANQTFLVSDNEDMSTAVLLRRMATAFGKPARLIPVPVGLIKLGAKMIGRPAIAQRLCGSLQVDISKTTSLLGWVPPVCVNEGLRQTAEYWLRYEAKTTF